MVTWEEDLPFIYNASDVFVYPSRFEGFGFPPLEAMACGIPVICSNAGALPEIAGDAALYIDPMDEDGIAEAMELMLDDPGCVGRLYYSRDKQFPALSVGYYCPEDNRNLQKVLSVIMEFNITP